MIRVFIGYDEDEIAAYHVLANSIIRHASQPVSIAPVASHLVPLTRGGDAKQSTSFAFSRFLVPYLCDFEGWAIWMDADMLCRTDIARLWSQRDKNKAVQVVPIDYRPENGTKFLGRPQSAYPELETGQTRKLWSAMMLMNCGKCAKLTPEYVNQAAGLDLHQFKWLDDHQIGYLPARWQHVAGVQNYRSDASLVHWTLGGPWWPEYVTADYAGEWRAEWSRLK